MIFSRHDFKDTSYTFWWFCSHSFCLFCFVRWRCLGHQDIHYASFATDWNSALTKKQTQTEMVKDKKDKLLPNKKGKVQSSKTGDYLGSRHCCLLPPQTSQSRLSINPASAAACRSRVLKAATSVCFFPCLRRLQLLLLLALLGWWEGEVPADCPSLPSLPLAVKSPCWKQGPWQSLPRPSWRCARGHPPVKVEG